jgi:Cft2 family RNA processing exonuclease
MLDCGVHPKKVGLDSLPDFSKVGDNTLDLIAVSHAHLDHSGALPMYALRQRFADILASATTCDLTLRMLRNSRNVMARQRQEQGIMEYPLFEFSQIDALKSRMLPMGYGRMREFENASGKVGVEFFRSGHIPGASSIAVETGKDSLLYTGDISFHPSQLIKGAQIPDRRYDVLIMETTRGASARAEDASYEQECERFITDVGRVIRDGGSVLVPAFALGRMQEVLQLVKKGMRDKLIPNDTPVFAAGLGIDISEYMLKEARKDPGVTFDKTAYDLIKPFRDKIVPAQDLEHKGIYIFGSGMMMENTPSYAAASALMDHPLNAIFFVGYCDPDTPGGRLLKKAKGDTTFVFQNLGFIAKTNCKIGRYDLSSHADRRELLDFALRVDPRVIILTHGDEEARNWFMDELLDIAPHIGIESPRPGESITI